MTMPPIPAAGTDSHKLLTAMLSAYPHPVWNPNSRLNITAHSRASDLRDLGWSVESVRGEAVPGTRKRAYGYRLASLPGATDAHGVPVLFAEVSA
jgi:hypothetical protein